MKLDFSFIIPVYNRPQEIDDLLKSMTKLYFDDSFEVVIIEDGSSNKSDAVIEKYQDELSISYYYKENTGPGDSRNYGMNKARGNYFIILDSDVLLPNHYLNSVQEELKKNYVDCFGGPDRAHKNFSDIQKAIDFTMTSFLTTGGIRGSKIAVQNFEPRSFNMGISQKAFQQSGGFAKIHPGEDPDLSIRLKQMGFFTKLIPSAYVYHKRRIDWAKFQKQVTKFGKVRPILLQWHPHTYKISYFFPTIFILGLVFGLVLASFSVYLILQFYVFYFLLIFMHASVTRKSIKVGLLAILACFIQFYGYGVGFLISKFYLVVLNKKPKEAFPELFFENK
ncbi:MAG: glycosyltransferase [Bacteroidota bacterium]